MRLRSASVILLFGTLALAQDIAHKDVVNEITGNLMCTCSCPHIIDQCGEECGMAPQLVHRISELVKSGQGPEDVYALFEEEYGPVVHAAPDTEGFNLLAWIFPFVGLLVGAIVVFTVARGLKSKTVEQDLNVSAPPIEDKYRRLLEKELE